MSVRQRINDREFNTRIEEIREMDHLFTKVGLPENGEIGSGKKKKRKMASEMSEVIKIGAIHEFGAPKANIPERPFVRPSYDENVIGLQEFKNIQAKRVIEGRQTAMVGIAKIGEWLTNKMKAKINSNIPPALKPMTIAKKGSSNSLIDTGQLLNSVQHVEEYR